MIAQDTILVQLIRLVDRIPLPPPPKRRPRGRPLVYSDRLFLKALVIMLVRNLHTINELLSVLAQPTPEMQALRVLLSTEPSRRFPSRRTWERRLKTLPESLPERIGLLGRHLLGLIRPWASGGASRGARQHGAQGTRRGVAQERPGGRQGAPHLHRYRGALDQGGLARVWVFGWKLHLACTVAGVWIPLDARLTPANEADSRLAPQLLQELPEEARFVLGDTHYNAPEVRELCESQGNYSAG